MGAQRGEKRRQPGRHRVLSRHERDPAARRVQAVRELAVGAVGQARWTVRAAYRHAVRLLADRRRVVQAADAHHQRAGRWRRPCRSGRPSTPRPDWDYVFVEAHTVGPGRLDDAARRQRPHRHRDRRQLSRRGLDRPAPVARPLPDATTAATACTPTGTTGAWNAASGSSGGWEQWSVDLGAYAGKQVEVSIAYASDWSTQGLGVFVDDVVVSTGEGSTSFEDGPRRLGGHRSTGRAARPNANDWIRTDASGFPVGAAITTPRTIIMGFGIEGISTPAERNAVMGRGDGATCCHRALSERPGGSAEVSRTARTVSTGRTRTRR